MKWIVMNIVFISIASAGFFHEEEAQQKEQLLENERLCKLFTEKAEAYKKTMRDDLLAKTTLASYEHRASLFCGKAKAAEGNTTAK